MLINCFLWLPNSLNGFLNLKKNFYAILIEFRTFIQLQQKKIMDELNNQEQNIEITVKRPFIPKFIKQLNYQQNEKIRKSKKRLKSQSRFSSENTDMIDGAAPLSEHKSSKKLHEVIRNGNRIIANWKNDQIIGEAQIYYSNGVTFKGAYQNGVKVNGHFKFLKGFQYKGRCLGNKFYGEGSLIFPSGKIITGEWREYNIIGKGKIQYPHGQVYYGQISNFKKHGKGYLFLNDGSKYVGEFKQGLINGHGVYYVNNQPVSNGLWQDGELIKQENISQINQSSIDFEQIDGKALEIQDAIKKTSDINKEEHPTSIGDFLGNQDEGKRKRKIVKFQD